MSNTSSYAVRWKSRVLLPTKEIRNGIITGVRLGRFTLKFDTALSVGTEIALEFYAKYRDQPSRIRVKAKVTRCKLTSTNGADIHLTLSQISREDNHTLNNVLQTLAESEALDLKASS